MADAVVIRLCLKNYLRQLAQHVMIGHVIFGFVKFNTLVSYIYQEISWYFQNPGIKKCHILCSSSQKKKAFV